MANVGYQGMGKCEHVGFGYVHRKPERPRFDPPLFEKIDMDKITEEEKMELIDTLLRRHRMVYYRLSQI